jgi:carbonic anhydrase
MKLLPLSCIGVLMAVGALAWVLFSGSAHSSEDGMNPDEALKLLMKGNDSYVRGKLDHMVTQSLEKSRTALSTGQKPYAIILCCSDSRVPPEILFNKGLGEIFVIRVAGNVVAPHELGSIEYAAEHLGSRLVMVLGHSRCGAVTAAYDAHPGTPEGNVGSILESIYPAVGKVKKEKATGSHNEMVESSIEENVKLAAREIRAKSPVIAHLAENRQVKIVGAKYDLYDGKVRLIPLD